ncbi:MAG TPA: hypothetical protein ENN19_08550 [Chloroflexi bacterium]|nr:hypothetical protein [Chloroflexota bacterium]
MIVIINGPCGIGKTSVAWELREAVVLAAYDPAWPERYAAEWDQIERVLGDLALADHLDFRDALRADAELRQQYQALKQTLSEQYRHERARYSESKSAFVEEALARWRGRKNQK